MKASAIIIAAALAGAPAGVAWAQQPGQAGQTGQTTTQQPGQAGQQPGQAGQQQARPDGQRQTDERTGAQTGARQQPQAQQQQRADAQQASGMVASDAITGINVRDHENENRGSIDRLIINRQSGEIEHVIVATGGFLGVGRDHVQISWDQLQLVRDNGSIVARVNRATLEGAPNVDRDRFDEAWGRTAEPRTGVGTTAGDRDRGTGVGTTGADRTDRDAAVGTAGTQQRAAQAGAAGANLIAGDRLTGSDVQDAQRRDLGRVERLMIDPQEGKVEYMVIGTGGFLGVGRDHILVPFDNVQVSMVDRDLVVTMDQSVIDQAPRAWTNDTGLTGDRDRGVTGDRGTTGDRR